MTLAGGEIAERIDSANVPTLLKSLPQWVLWKYQPVPGKPKPKKPPFQTNGRVASVGDPQTWCSYRQAMAALDTGHYKGIGFMLEGSGIVVIDLDNCLREVNGVRRITIEARQIVDIAQSYTEVSPSGKGLHIFLRGHLPEEDGHPVLGMKSDKGEMYAARRYITITGERVGEATEIRADQDAIHRIYALLKPPKQTPVQPAAPARHQGVTSLNDEEVKKQARTAGNGAKFHRLYYQGDITGYRSRSEAHFALVALLAFRTKDAEQIDRIFRTSQLYQSDEEIQEKWDQRHYADGKTYGQRTIEKAIGSSIGFGR